ncbi:hypothetical protein F5Y04DRAFT_280558 [Hypomontagnella monticulosa]|nr:hypothetical protein F5Y04DRAFT_280558 [Hypomontagnella monticulosa]
MLNSDNIRTNVRRTAEERDGKRVLIQAVVHDPRVSRDTLNSYRRQLGLGPSSNLVYNPAPETPVTQNRENDDVYRHPHYQEEEEAVASPYYTADEIQPHNDDPSEPEGSERQRSFSIKKTAGWGRQPSDSISNTRRPPTSRYLGNHSLARNRCADIPDRLSCRLWITGLPPDCTVSKLLGSIRGMGPVYATHMNGPEFPKPTSAASLTFFAASSANQFLLWHSLHPFTIDGYTTKVVRHRVKTESFPVDGQSRVISIRGSREIVNPDFLKELFSKRWGIEYTTDFLEYRPGKEISEIVWAFGSWRAQANGAYIGLRNHFADYVTVKYLPDPCS